MAVRTSRIAATTSASPIAGVGPRFPGGFAGAPGLGGLAAYTLERATRQPAQIIVSG
ncbi:MAG: hypothetical protein QN119_13220 [Armatimonadota bacterium]|nr:hypothetical protein [Armatimonadota bacterium]